MAQATTVFDCIGDLIESVQSSALQDYHATHFRYIDQDEMEGAYLAQVQTILIDRPGGRLTVSVVITPKPRAKKTEHFYYRFQRLPGLGYMQQASRRG